MKIVNSEVSLPKTSNPTSEYFEVGLKNLGYDFIRWAVVRVDEDKFVLNVSHKS